MKKNIFTLCFLSFLTIFVSSCQVQWTKILSTQHQKLPVVATNETLAIHAKMIAKDDVFVVIINEKKYLSNAERELILNSDIIISDTALEKSKIWSVLQNYKGTYLNVWWNNEANSSSIASKTNEIDHITAIRDALSEINPNKKWTYYDNAGTYIQTLGDTYTKLYDRIRGYNHSNFIIVWKNIHDFLTDFGLEKYNMGTLETTEKTNQVIWEEVLSMLQIKNTWIIFTDSDSTRQILTPLLKKTHAQIYIFPQIEEDTSEWWYIRYIEKMMNVFVSAFDTYD